MEQEIHITLRFNLAIGKVNLNEIVYKLKELQNPIIRERPSVIRKFIMIIYGNSLSSLNFIAYGRMAHCVRGAGLE